MQRMEAPTAIRLPVPQTTDTRRFLPTLCPNSNVVPQLKYCTPAQMLCHNSYFVPQFGFCAPTANIMLQHIFGAQNHILSPLTYHFVPQLIFCAPTRINILYQLIYCDSISIVCSNSHAYCHTIYICRYIFWPNSYFVSILTY